MYDGWYVHEFSPSVSGREADHAQAGMLDAEHFHAPSYSQQSFTVGAYRGARQQARSALGRWDHLHVRRGRTPVHSETERRREVTTIVVETIPFKTWWTAMGESEFAGTFRPSGGRAFVLCEHATKGWLVYSIFNESHWPSFVGEHGPSVVTAATEWVKGEKK